MYDAHRDLHLLTHSFPTRRSSDLVVFLLVLALRLAALADMGGQKAVHVDHAAADDRRARRRLAVQNRAQYSGGKGPEARHVLSCLMPRQRHIAGIEQLAELKFDRRYRRLDDRPLPPRAANPNTDIELGRRP